MTAGARTTELTNKIKNKNTTMRKMKKAYRMLSISTLISKSKSNYKSRVRAI